MCIIRKEEEEEYFLSHSVRYSIMADKSINQSFISHNK